MFFIIYNVITFIIVITIMVCNYIIALIFKIFHLQLYLHINNLKHYRKSPMIVQKKSDIWDYSIGQIKQIEQFLKARTYSEKIYCSCKISIGKIWINIKIHFQNNI